MDIKTPGTDIPDTLVALDWSEVTCQSAEGCSNLATHIVHVHMVDDCDDPNLDSCGNLVDILCATCLRDVLFEALQQVDRIGRYPGACCLTCGAPVRRLSDVMRRVAQLHGQPGEAA